MWPHETAPERNTRLFGVERPVAFVTGSSAPRVGNAIAAYLAAQRFQIVLHGRDLSNQELIDGGERGSGERPSGDAYFTGDCLQLTGAIEKEEHVAGWTKQISAKFGRMDVLVNAAAIWEPKSLEETTARDFERFFRVNTLGIALTCKHFGLLMTQQEFGGAIINIGDWAKQRPYRDFAAYFTSKGAIETLTQTMAVELGSRNPRVRVNAVLPGPVMLDASIGAEHREQIARQCLLQREGTAADVATAVLFLATSPFVTGVCLPVDGGRTIHAGPSTDPLAHPSLYTKPRSGGE